MDQVGLLLKDPEEKEKFFQVFSFYTSPYERKVRRTLLNYVLFRLKPDLSFSRMFSPQILDLTMTTPCRC